MSTFDAANVAIERHRISVTQGEVSVSYNGTLLGRFGDDIRLCTDKTHNHGGGAVCFGGFHGHPDQHWIDAAARHVDAAKPTAAQERIAAKEKELEAAKAAFYANCNRRVGCTNMRSKQHGRRINAQLKLAGEQRRTITRLERELEGLRRQATRPAPAPLDLSRLPYAEFIRTDAGWYEVVKVNKATVKVVNTPGMDDLIKIRKILEIRERVAAPAAADGWAQLADALTDVAK